MKSFGVAITSLDEYCILSLAIIPNENCASLCISDGCEGGMIDLDFNMINDFYGLLSELKKAIIHKEVYHGSLKNSYGEEVIQFYCAGNKEKSENAYIAYDEGVCMTICYVSVKEVNKLLKTKEDVLKRLN